MSIPRDLISWAPVALAHWERGRPMELWQMDVVGGFLLADGTSVKALTGVDDHSRFCISARLMVKERTQLVCDGLGLTSRTFGAPEQLALHQRSPR